MKLFYKIYIFLIITLIVILGSYGYIVYQREINQFSNDMERNAFLLGHAISGPIGHIWEKSGMDMALQLINDVNRGEDQINIRWIWLDNRSHDLQTSRLPSNLRNKIISGESISLTMNDLKGELFRFSYIPIKIPQNSMGAIEISESLMEMKKYTRDSFVHLFYTGALLLLTFGVILWHRFNIWIHQPLQRFIEKSAKIGEGDLEPDLELKGSDEFSQLAATFNGMCENLNATLNSIRVEHEKRICALEQLRHTERLATLGRLSAGVAHELGTPLNVISGRSKLIHNGRLTPPEIVDNARIIGEQSHRMTQIIQSLLDFSRRRHLNRQYEDMTLVVDKVIEMLTSTAAKAKVSLEWVQKEKLPQVFIDFSQIQQVLTNLIMNGIQAMPQGGTLSLSMFTVDTHPPEENLADKPYLAVQLEDEGQGIAEENMAYLFEPFFTTKEMGQGSGLGLSIVFGIVEEHGGWINVKNRADRGACITVFFPLEDCS
ncbi:sensor histidine kinase [Desulfocicer niacini]